jgi:hypothetical protein
VTWPTYAETKAARARDEAAAAEVLARGPIDPPAEELARVTWLLTTAAWRFARTYAKTNPHEYTLRWKWENDDEFIACVLFIRRFGYVHRFGKSNWPYIQFDLAGHMHWTMGDPCLPGPYDRRAERGVCLLINRKPLPPIIS